MKIVTKSIPRPFYRKIYRLLPIFCVDAVVMDGRGRFLLTRRTNKPMRGAWWFPGGRVLKNESARRAVLRKLREETGLSGQIIRELGFYNLIVPDGYFSGTNTHTPIVVFLVKVRPGSVPMLNQQHNAARWFTRIDPHFHPYPK